MPSDQTASVTHLRLTHSLITLAAALSLLITTPVLSQPTLIESDSLILVELFFATGGSGWATQTNPILGDWLVEDSRAVDWGGVTTDEELRLRTLLLVNNNIGGRVI